MGLTEDFTGTALPADWTLSTPASGTATVADSRVTLTLPSGTSFDSYFSTSGGGATDNSCGVEHAAVLHGNDLDVAAQFDTDCSNRKGQGSNLIVKGAAASEYVRVTLFKTNDTQYAASIFGYTRNAAAGAVAPTTTSMLAGIYTFQSGAPSWLRLSYVDSTGLWTVRVSTDGWNWITAATATRQFTPVTVKAAFTSTTPATGGSLRLNQVIDVLERGNDDLRSTLPARNRDTISLIRGTDSVLPAGWVDDSVAPSTITFVSNVLRFADSPTVTGVPHPTARMRWAGTAAAEWGLVFKVRNSDPDANCFGTFGAGVYHGSWVDQYTFGHGYAIEVQSGTTRHPIRQDDIRNTDVNVPVNPPTNLDERPYYWLKNLTAEPDMTLNTWRWFRLERIARRIRMKEWADGVSEPDTWNLYDGQDEVIGATDTTSVPALSLSRNLVTSGGTVAFDFDSIEFYSITALATIGGTSGGGMEFHITSSRSEGRGPTEIMDVAHERYRRFKV